MAEGVTLREYLEEQLRHERELRETIESKLGESLRLQATETLRRLDELNHAHSVAAENWRTSLPRELFDQYKDEQVKWKEGVNALTNKIIGAMILIVFMGMAGLWR